MKKHSTLFLIPLLGLGITTLSSCNNNYDAKLVVYNWEDYIYTGTDEFGNIIDEEGGIVDRFEKYISEKTGKKMTDALIGYYPNLSCVMGKIINLETNDYCSEDNVHLSDVIKFQKELCDELKQIKLINRE